MKRQKEDFPPEDKAFVTRTVKIADKLTEILHKDSPNEYIALVALSVVYKAAVLAICKSYWENSDKMTEKQRKTRSYEHIRQYRIDLATMAIRLPNNLGLLPDTRIMLTAQEGTRQYSNSEAICSVEDLNQEEDPEATSYTTTEEV